jgi:peptidoglycan hydrolase CwlO-like protein
LINEVDKDLEALTKYVQEDLQATLTNLENTLKAADLENQNAIAKVASDLLAAKTELAAKDAAIEASLNAAITRITENETKIAEALQRLTAAEAEIQANKEAIADNADAGADNAEAIAANEQAIAALKSAYEIKVAELVASINEKAAAIEAEQQARKAADEELKTLYTSADAALKAELKGLITANTNKIATCEADIATLEATVTELENKINAVLADVEANKQSITAVGQAIDTLEGQVAELQSQVAQLATALRSVVLVPETMHNGTKAVKFHRMEGENVMKTFAYVSFHFNPSNFDVASAEYEVVAENVEFRTKAVLSEDPAIEIVGTPVKDGDKVTFLLERAEGAGNMFALKVTLADGTTIYSEYAAILDEATFVTANAVASVDVARLSFLFPSINSLSDLIETIKSLGTVAEDFEAYVASVKAAIEAVQNNDYISAMQNLAKFPFFSTSTETIYGYGSHTVQVETFDAEQFFEELMNAQSVSEITNILSSLIGKAEGLGGAVGDSIVQGIQNALGATDGLAGLLGQYGDLTGKLPELENSVSTATAYLQQMLDNITPDLTPLKETLAQQQAELAAKQAELDVMISGLDAETKAQVLALYEEHAVLEAQYNATQAELNAAEAEYEAMSLKDKFSSAGVKLAARIAELGATATYQSGLVTAKEAEITAKVGTTEFFTKMAEIAAVKVKIGTTESSISTLESVIKGAQDALDNAQGNLDSVKDKLADLEQKILDAAKNRLEDTELGQYIKQLENALAEEGWNARKTIAEADAKIWASDAALADLIKNYEAANEQVVEEFKESILGRVAYLIKTDEAAKAFETLGLSEVHAALKLVPDLLTVVLKYYPTSISDLQGVIPQITEVTWETDYLLVDYVPAE